MPMGLLSNLNEIVLRIGYVLFMGSIMVAWDNGSGLNVVYGVDICRKVVE